MIDMVEIETQGPTVEEAIRRGLEQLHAQRDDVEIKILDEGSTGLFGLMGAKPAIVQLKKHAAGTKEISSDFEQMKQKSKLMLEELLKHMNIVVQEIRVTDKEESVYIEVQTPDSAVLIDKQGKILQALQFLLTLMMSKIRGARVSIYVDVNGYRKQFEDQLIQQAHQAAQEVRQNKKPKYFEPMPSYDRKIIHLALKDEQDVVTESTGSGLLRKVYIRPKE